MNLDFASFSSVFGWVVAHSYFLIFLAMCFEGPVTTTAAGFASALGFFDPWIILIISILGDLVPDTIYYYIGYVGNQAAVEKISKLGGWFGLTRERAQRIEKLLREHFNKTMVLLKLTPVATVPGFIVVGYLRLSFRRFFILCSAVTVPKSIIFLLLGYFFGQLYNINQYIRYIGIFLPLVVLFGIVVYFIYKKIVKTITEKNGKL